MADVGVPEGREHRDRTSLGKTLLIRCVKITVQGGRLPRISVRAAGENKLVFRSGLRHLQWGDLCRLVYACVEWMVGVLWPSRVCSPFQHSLLGNYLPSPTWM